MFYVFHEGYRPVYEISQQYQTDMFNKCDHEIFLSETEHHVLQEEGLLWHSSSSSCNIWPLFYFIDLQRLYIPCLPLLIFLMTSCNVSF